MQKWNKNEAHSNKNNAIILIKWSHLYCYAHLDTN